MLFGSTILEVAIGVIFVYLLLSLLCSALNEFIEANLQMRAKDLEKGVIKLLSDPQAQQDGTTHNLANDFLAHPLVQALYQTGNRPAYIPARTFSLALWNTVATKGGTVVDIATSAATQLEGIKTALNQLPANNRVRVALTTLINEAGGDVDKARKNIEDWYDSAMDRVSGGYKRRTHLILIVLGFIVAGVINADSINIANALSHDDALRRSVTAAAETYIKTPPPANPNQSPQERMKDIRGQIDQLGLPIGWVNKPMSEDARGLPSRWGWLLKVFGWGLTALAISQGAPFWFDILNKFIVVRSTVKPHEKSPEQPTKDAPAPKTERETDTTEDAPTSSKT